MFKRSPPLSFPFPDGIVVDRRDKILSGLDLRVYDGVEIGALTSPLVSQDEGNIFYVDHADTNSLREKYTGDSNVNLANLVEVGGVWGGKHLRNA